MTALLEVLLLCIAIFLALLVYKKYGDDFRQNRRERNGSSNDTARPRNRDRQ